MRLLKYFNILTFLLALSAFAVPARAQFLGYTSPQTEQQVLATNVACTGLGQYFSPSNLGLTEHYVTVTPAGATSLSVKIMGQDVNGFNMQISDVDFPGLAFSASSVIKASGYYPKIVVIVVCTGGTFSLSYSGASSASDVTAGLYLVTQISKTLFNQAPQNTSAGSPTLATPYGSSSGKLVFQYITAGIAGSTVTVVCQSASTSSPYQTWTYALQNTAAVQMFQVPDSQCPFAQISYLSGGASANTFYLDYVFDFPGRNGVTSSAATLSALQNLGVPLTEKGARWSVISNPAAGSQASASKAAGTNATYHVVDCVSFSAASTTAPALTALTINLRNGASGAGTVIWTQQVAIPASTGQNVQPFSVCGLNLIGSSNTAMTLEFSAALANLIEAATITGYDVQ